MSLTNLLSKIQFTNCFPHYNVYRKQINEVKVIRINIAASFTSKDIIEDELTCSIGYQVSIIDLSNNLNEKKNYKGLDNLLKYLKYHKHI